LAGFHSSLLAGCLPERVGRGTGWLGGCREGGMLESDPLLGGKGGPDDGSKSHVDNEPQDFVSWRPGNDSTNPIFSLGKRTGWRWSLVVSLFILLAHAMILFGQIAHIWDLFYSAQLQVTIDSSGPIFSTFVSPVWCVFFFA